MKKFEYQRQQVSISEKDRYTKSYKSIDDIMTAYGDGGWDIFSVVEYPTSYTSYDDVYIVTDYVLYMKREIE